MFTWLWSDFIEEHCQIRYTSLLLIDKLFVRSCAFRFELLGKLESFLKLSTGIKQCQLPPPEKYHEDLKTMTLKCLHQWYLLFGDQEKKVREGYIPTMAVINRIPGPYMCMYIYAGLIDDPIICSSYGTSS